MEKFLNKVVKELIEHGYVIEIEDDGVVQFLITKDNVETVKINVGVE